MKGFDLSIFGNHKVAYVVNLGWQWFVVLFRLEALPHRLLSVQFRVPRRDFREWQPPFGPVSQGRYNGGPNPLWIFLCRWRSDVLSPIATMRMSRDCGKVSYSYNSLDDDIPPGPQLAGPSFWVSHSQTNAI